jgi:intracellular sulfur oxidation DsrE/DsrF family protein
MRTNPVERTLLVALLAAGLALGTAARGARAPAPKGPAVRVDIPVTLQKADLVFDMGGKPSLDKGEPMALRAMKGLSEQFAKDGVPHRIVAVFYGPSTAMVLKSGVYDRKEHATGANPFKAAIEKLQAQGVAVEVCAVSLEKQGLGNTDLLPGVKVTSNALLRIIQLQQEGYVRVRM